VDHLGVLVPCRGRGVGAALLRHSLATFAGRGVRRVILNVDAENPTGAPALYERVGMRVVKRWDLWERSSATPVAPARAPRPLLDRPALPDRLNAQGRLAPFRLVFHRI
jgi:predicted N-acetyltransferase YhbS